LVESPPTGKRKIAGRGGGKVFGKGIEQGKKGERGRKRGKQTQELNLPWGRNTVHVKRDYSCNKRGPSVEKRGGKERKKFPGH